VVKFACRTRPFGNQSSDGLHWAAGPQIANFNHQISANQKIKNPKGQNTLSAIRLEI
jgi:hypothetical protein